MAQILTHKKRQVDVAMDALLLVTLRSKGAPDAFGFLNCEWIRTTQTMNGRPCFLLSDLSGTSQPLHMYYAGGHWQIAADINAGLVFAAARSFSEHPNTVTPQSWRLATGEAELQPCESFEVECDGPNTVEQPFEMVDLGADFFFRAQIRRRVIWYRCPRADEVFHSGAKGGGDRRDRPGKRFCPLCQNSFSANNFKSQHVANLHRPAAPTEVMTRPIAGGLELCWVPPPQARDVPPTLSYCVQFMVEGDNWQVGVKDTMTAEPRVTLENLQPLTRCATPGREAEARGAGGRIHRMALTDPFSPATHPPSSARRYAFRTAASSCALRSVSVASSCPAAAGQISPSVASSARRPFGKGCRLLQQHSAIHVSNTAR